MPVQPEISTVVNSAALLRGDLIDLLKKRQEAGNELTKALAKAKYHVAYENEWLVIDRSGALNRLEKKKTKAKAKAKAKAKKKR